MFGYVMPYKLELKIKDYEMFKAYYCGLCLSIKENFSNLCRLSLNYDMTFLGILLDSLSADKNSYEVSRCIAHPLKKKPKVINNKALNYAAFCNVALVYYKLLDDYNDDKALTKKLLSIYLKKFIENENLDLKPLLKNMEDNLAKLTELENSTEYVSIDELSHSFADLTGFLISFYYNDQEFQQDLYTLGYNLGRWIYIIDAYDDLEDDLKKQKFNAINKAFNTENLSFEELIEAQRDRIEFNLMMSASTTVDALNNLPLKKNNDLLFNILQFGLMNKIEIIKSRSDKKDEKSI